MKKLMSIFAVVVMSIGLFSCEAENTVEETDALYENLEDTTASDNEQVDNDAREG